jgi:hypothetical protein
MSLTHREQASLEQLALITLTATRLAPLRRYATPARSSNDNRNQNNCDVNDGSRDACLRLADKVGSSWRIRNASLLAITNSLHGL